MKKTSIVFLCIAVLLIICGIVVKNKGLEKAEAKNLELFRQELRDNGDFVETVKISTEDTNKININLKNADINVIGGCESSYVEIINFNALEYASYSNNRSFNIENDLISSLTGRAEGGSIKFNGVRDFVRFDKHNQEKMINVYLAADSAVKIFNITLDEGNVSFEGITPVCDYTIILNNGDVSFKNTPEISLVDVKTNKGDLTMENAYVSNANIKLDNGNVVFSTPSTYIYDFEIESETGEIKYNSDTHKGKFVLENDEPNGIIVMHIGVGNVAVTTFEQAPAETPETAPAQTEAPNA